MCVCQFIEVHIAAQSSPFMLFRVFLCYLRWSSQGDQRWKACVPVFIVVGGGVKRDIASERGDSSDAITSHASFAARALAGR